MTGNKWVMLLTLTAILARPHSGRAEDAVTQWIPQASAKYLDDRAEWWLSWSGSARGQGTACLSCHTTVPYALARPVLDEQLGRTTPGIPEKRLIEVLEKRVAHWDKIVAQDAAQKNPFVPFYSGKRRPSALGTESVLNALILVNHDVHRHKGVLRPPTKQALTHMWEQQQKDGGWLWLHFGLNPWENDAACYGVSLAALAAGMAGKEHLSQPALQSKVARLERYLQGQSAAQPLHHRLVLLWASSTLPGALQPDAKAKLIEEIFLAQESDGGWSLARLGRRRSLKEGWARHGIYPAAVSDGYATGLAVLALSRAAVPADNPKLREAVRWLQRHQKEGTWPAAYPNRERDPHSDVGKFMRDAATGFAILALGETGLRRATPGTK